MTTTTTTETETVKRPRAANVTEKQFLEKFIPMAKAGSNCDEIAEALGMNRGSFNTKHHNLRQKVRVGSTVYQVGEKQVTGEQLFKGSIATEKDVKKRLTYSQIAAKGLEIVTAGVEMVKPKGSRGESNSVADLASLVTALMGADEQSEQGEGESADAETDGES